MVRKKQYKKPKIGIYKVDKEISLILMSWNDDDNPPDDPFGTAGQAATQQNPFNDNAFDQPLQ